MASAKTNSGTTEALKQLTYLASALKAPRSPKQQPGWPTTPADAGWTHEEYLAAVLDREVAARNASGAQLRIRAAGSPHARRSRSSIGTPNPPRANRSPPWHRWLPHRSPQRRPARPARHRKTHLATGLGIAAANHGHRVLFANRDRMVTRLTDAHRAGRLPQELARLRRYGLIIVDEVGYLPFEQDAANLFFQLVSSRYEHASLILTSNLPFSGGAASSATRPWPPR